jgi:hypothetical protein
LTATLLAGIELPIPLPIHLQVAPDWRLRLYSAVLAMGGDNCERAVSGVAIAEGIHQPSSWQRRRSRLLSTLVVTQMTTSVIILATGFCSSEI